MIRNKTAVLISVILVIYVHYSCSSKSKIDQISQSTIASFFQDINTSDHNKALEALLRSNTNISFTDSATIRLRSGFDQINETSGKYLGAQILKKRVIGNDIAIYSYLVKYEIKYYRFIFSFYSSTSEPKIYKFSYDDMVDLELEESMKLYIQ